MKKILLLLLTLLSLQQSLAQNPDVEKSIFGVQTGFLGFWGFNESRLATKIALRSEIGLNAGFFGGTFIEDGFIMVPSFTLEPRYYYNINKRNEKGKRTHHNAANFVSLDITYLPKWFAISNVENVGVLDNISFVPKWGIRRNIGEHFNYEIGLGLGYRIYFSDEITNPEDKEELAGDLHLRIGYTF
ncbi:hypothetical protein HX109_09430 [Galbibacter sp. BG1]|uniref:hypothetical protein n=1 Tax=Galbibacter sp. BG1 TaxID=1170699 RepID=UPI0015B7E050|nr:hypothetical protein [Galbibacter sp. BG1]QLE01767.1 hypothetical protein HX109_09430 [Galbibacter sp. BG1]